MIRLGVVGHGYRMSRMIKLRMREIMPDLRIVAIIDPDEQGARDRLDECDRDSVIFYNNLDEMVRKANLDALAIGTRCNLHTPYAIQAAKYDIPLYLEKPVAINMEQAIQLEYAYENSRCNVIVAFPLRVTPMLERVQKLIDDGQIGTPYHICAVNFKNGIDFYDTWYRDYSITQGLFIQKATHDIDYIRYLMKSPIVKVAATWTRGKVFGGNKPEGLKCSQCNDADTCPESPLNRKVNQSGVNSPRYASGDHLCLFAKDLGSPETGMNEDSSSIMMQFESGAHGVYNQAFYARRDATTRGSTIMGYNGTIKFDWSENELKLTCHHSPFSSVWKGAETLAHYGGDMGLNVAFRNMIKNETKPKTTIWDGIQSIYVCLAAKQSAESDKFVTVRQVGSVK